jgi:hypothetical protein
MAATFTTEQLLPFEFQVVDGRGRIVPIDGAPVCTVSDQTVATASIEDNGDNTWSGELTSVAEGTARMTIEADADLGSGVESILATLDFDVTLDPRTEQRMATVTAGSPSDKPVTPPAGLAT